MRKPPRLTLINGTPAPDTPKERARRRVRAMPKPLAMLRCPRCGGHEVIETKTGVMKRDGKVSGGAKTLICADCHSRGERIVVA